MMRCTRRRAPRLVRVAVIVTVAVAAALPAMQAGAATRAPGTGKPPVGSGINTPAVLADPLCDRSQGPYGRFAFVFKGGGPVCVAAWKEGKNNGGATYNGVTKDKISVIAIV